MSSRNDETRVIDHLEREGGNVSWRRAGIAPLVSGEPQRQLSGDGDNGFVHGPMTATPDGCAASGAPDAIGHVRARAWCTASACLIEASLEPDLVFANGFE